MSAEEEQAETTSVADRKLLIATLLVQMAFQVLSKEESKRNELEQQFLSKAEGSINETLAQLGLSCRLQWDGTSRSCLLLHDSAEARAEISRRVFGGGHTLTRSILSSLIASLLQRLKRTILVLTRSWIGKDETTTTTTTTITETTTETTETASSTTIDDSIDRPSRVQEEKEGQENEETKRIQQFRFELTGQDGYMGDFMMEYEINPCASGEVVYWPDITRFSAEHTERYTVHHSERLAEHAVFCLLCDLPHEVVHLLQSHQIIPPHSDDGWLAEHDPSVCALNLLHFALTGRLGQPTEQAKVPIQQEERAAAREREGERERREEEGERREDENEEEEIVDQWLQELDDEWKIEGLFAATRLWLGSRIIDYVRAMGEEAAQAEAEYQKWRRSSGFEQPLVDAASLASDYLKTKAAFEAFPVSAARQLAAFFRRRSGSIRDLAPPPLATSFPSSPSSVFTLFALPELDSSN